jgi:glycosyltransferase involved in cell wall biosynthesis
MPTKKSKVAERWVGRLRIWVDALVLDEKAAGVGQYIRSLCEAYGAIFPEDQVFGLLQPNIAIPGVASLTVPDSASSARRMLYEQTQLAGVVKRRGYDAIHFADYQMPLWRPLPRSVITVHDLAAFVLPDVFEPSKTRAKRYVLSRSVRRASRIIVPSQATKRDLIDILRVPAEKIHVVMHGVKSAGQPLEGRVHERPYFLAVGTVEPRKNFSRMIQAYHLLVQRSRDVPDLVVAGRWGWMYHETLELPEKLGVAQNVKFLQYVSEDTLTTLYRDAQAMIYPSLYEGFGLPVIEAMRAGIPVVTTNGGALAELGADAPWRADPLDIEDLADKMQQVIHAGPDVGRRVRQAQEWTSQLTWECAAKKTREVYHEAALGG